MSSSLGPMRAVVLSEKGSLELRRDTYIDQPRGGEVLVRILSSGVCHTDLHVIEGKVSMQLPAILGHEIFGIVEKVGEGVASISEGDYVISSFMWPCGRCRLCTSGYENLCERSIEARARGVMLDGTARVWIPSGGGKLRVFVRNGGFAEYAVIPSENSLARVPEGLRSPEIAILGCAFLTAYGAVFNSARVSAGDVVAVYGVGGVGMAIVRFASIAGAEVIAVDVVDEKLEKARKLGARAVVNRAREDPVETIRSMTGGGADIAFEAVGIPTTARWAVESVKIGGKVVQVGIGSRVEIDLNRLVIRGITIVGSYGARPRVDLQKIMNLVGRGLVDLKEFVTGVYRLEDFEKAFEDVKKGRAIRTLLLP